MLQHDCERLDPRIREPAALNRTPCGLMAKEFDKLTIQDITEAATLTATFLCPRSLQISSSGKSLSRVSFFSAGTKEKSALRPCSSSI